MAMRAVTVPQPGGPEALVVGQVETPTPGPLEILLAVEAAGVNRADVLQRRGLYPPPPGTGDVLGLEAAGTVVELGEGVDTSWLGRRVCALLAGGGLAERVAVPTGQLLDIPDGFSMTQAAALPEVLATVHANLVGTAGLRSGDTVLLHGGGSGIGTAAIQLVRALGATAIVTVGSQEKAEACRELGAEHTILYQEQDFVEEITRITRGRGVDIVLDLIGAKYLDANLRALALDGRLVIIGLLGGAKAEADLGRMLAKRLSIHATTLRSRSIEQKAEIIAGLERDVWPLVASGRITPVIDRVLPLEQVAEAHRLLEDSAVTGKIVLTV